MHSNSFHAHHSPMGAHASLTYGMYGAQGGLGLELGAPARGGFQVGYQDADGTIYQLPFLKMSEDEIARYHDGGDSTESKDVFIPESEIEREYLWATDRFIGGGITLETITPFFSIPDPATSSDDAQKFACCPALFVSFAIDNTDGADTRTGFLAFQHANKWRALKSGGITGAASRDEVAFATNDEAHVYVDWSFRAMRNRPETAEEFLLAGNAGLWFDVPAGESRQITVAVAFYREGNATFGHRTRYWYTRLFDGIESVLRYALDNREAYLHEAVRRDTELQEAKLSDAQRFLIAHATRSYYGSTELLDDDGKPRWVVNEGEYLMMNTFDLTVDMLFYEMRWNPWTVRNVLEQFVDEYSYIDQVFDPADPDTMYDGGISFTHDMGVANHFSPQGRSSYEVKGLDRLCFSYMTCEQLTNWICCAGVYYTGTKDTDFLAKYKKALLDCFRSLQNRDNPDPAKRNGLMSFESSMTWPGGEITTYDSLDHSLGQARNNIYLASKSWASYLALERLFNELGLTAEAQEAAAAARLCADTLVAAYDESLGFIPAVLENDNESAIIPAIEGLIFPKVMGIDNAITDDGPYGDYVQTLRRHLRNILDSGACLYDDGAWQLSSTADNSWMSKICLCQHVARAVLGVPVAPESDEAHVRWEINGSKFQACSDQFRSGVAKGSRYYPRIVTSILWLDE